MSHLHVPTFHCRSWAAPSASRHMAPNLRSRTVMKAALGSQPEAAAAPQLSRRSLLGGTCAVLSLLSFQGVGLAELEIPKAYQELAFKLIEALEDSILADVNGAPEREVRRKADPAKNLVRQYVQRWQDEPALQGEESHRLITDTLQQLGQFYQANGSRARLGEELGNRLLEQLHTAEQALPPLPESKLLPFPF